MPANGIIPTTGQAGISSEWTLMMKLSLLTTLMASLSLSAGYAQATPNETVTEGSTTTHRSNVDGDSGEIFVYVGGAFPKGTSPTTFTFLGFCRTGRQQHRLHYSPLIGAFARRVLHDLRRPGNRTGLLSRHKLVAANYSVHHCGRCDHHSQY